MVDESGKFRPRMHPDDLSQLADMMRQGTATSPATTPPADGNGKDAKSWKLLEEMLERKLGEFQEKLLAKCETRVLSIFADLDMPLEPQKEKNETRNKLKEVFDLLEGVRSWKREFFSKLVLSSAGWIVSLLLVGFWAFVQMKAGGFAR